MLFIPAGTFYSTVQLKAEKVVKKVAIDYAEASCDRFISL